MVILGGGGGYERSTPVAAQTRSRHLELHKKLRILRVGDLDV